MGTAYRTTDAVRQQAIAMRRAGASREQIQEAVGVSRAQLAPIIATRTINMRWTNGARATTAAERETMLKLRSEGKTLQQIGDVLGRKRQVIAYWLNRFLGDKRNERGRHTNTVIRVPGTTYLSCHCPACDAELQIPPHKQRWQHHFCDADCYHGWKKEQATSRAARQADG
jgi:transposase-like protein